jgi:P-type Cu+ transporter
MITGYFVPIVTLLAIVTWVIWLSLGMSGSLPQDYLDIPVGGWREWLFQTLNEISLSDDTFCSGMVP